MVMRWINILALAAVCVCAINLYIYKLGTQHRFKQAAAIEEKIGKERELIGVLETEWSHLTRPERIERLARQYLGMAPAVSDQISEQVSETGSLPSALPPLSQSQTETLPYEQDGLPRNPLRLMR